MIKTLSFNNDVVVEVFDTSKGLYDFHIYTDVNKEKVECDNKAYQYLCNDLDFYTTTDEKTYGLKLKTLCKVLRKIEEATNETYWKLSRTY